jgi:hypothetical protein
MRRGITNSLSLALYWGKLKLRHSVNQIYLERMNTIHPEVRYREYTMYTPDNKHLLHMEGNATYFISMISYNNSANEFYK